MVTIRLEIDKSCSMAKVSDGFGDGMEGNFWDFHNGCHGVYFLKKFNTPKELVNVLKNIHISRGSEVNVVESEYKYCS